MKFCLSARQDALYLSKADEVVFKYRDRKAVDDFFENYKTPNVIISHSPYDEPIDWKEIKLIKNIGMGRLILCLSSIQDCEKAKELGIPFYHMRPVNNYYDLQGLKELGVCYVVVAAPLIFDLENVKKFGIPVRVFPNAANLDGLPRENRICGPWIRPEDLKYYSQLIDVVEFQQDINKKIEEWLPKERALYRIYAEQHEWPDRIDMIINEIGSNAINRMIDPELALKRVSCGQRCITRGSCHACESAFALADPNRIQDYTLKIKKDLDE